MTHGDRNKRGHCDRTGKKMYKDAADAKRAITNIKGQVGRNLPDTGKVPMRAYRCPFCGGLHLTSEKEYGT